MYEMDEYGEFGGVVVQDYQDYLENVRSELLNASEVLVTLELAKDEEVEELQEYLKKVDIDDNFLSQYCEFVDKVIGAGMVYIYGLVIQDSSWKVMVSKDIVFVVDRLTWVGQIIFCLNLIRELKFKEVDELVRDFVQIILEELRNNCDDGDVAYV